ncbi:DUF2852 domain-containing protein [Pararhizobium haloflavum]|uniref:DUF2852 domain-containing protein n=1 Tax=Pararhizobium haloflavum TaxID=2037914 RepID=UPI000C18520C|nr:DUF2852 domain-containing protein [Pararhizobium haloflavum]
MTTSHVHAARSCKPAIRPDWTPATIGLMVLGFIVFWPLGLAMLAYIIWGDRLPVLKRDLNRATDSVFSSVRGGASQSMRARTGNVAFDDWREAELARLEAERARLEEMRDEFEDYARELRRAKDKEEFDRFMANRKPRDSNRDGPTIDAE